MTIKRIFLIMVIFFGVCSIVGVGYADKVDHAEKAFNAGMKAYNNEDYQNAVYAFQNSLKYDEKLYKSHYMLGLSLFMNNEAEIAENYLIKMIDEFPKEWKLQILLAEYYAGQKKYETSIAYYEKALDVKKMSKNEKRKYQEKLDALILERSALWQVTEEEKENILKQISFMEKTSWRPITVEKKGSELHLVYLPKEEDVNKWKSMIDIHCSPVGLGGFQEVNQKTADKFRELGAILDTVEADGQMRIFETRVSGKDKYYVLGRIFKSKTAFCVAQIKKKGKLKPKDIEEWTAKLKSVSVD